jgi:hypothetical protein
MIRFIETQHFSHEDANHFCSKMMNNNLINNNMIIDQLYNNLKGKE